MKKLRKPRYKLRQRSNGYFQFHDNLLTRTTSLFTKNETEAMELIEAMNKRDSQSRQQNLQMAKVYMEGARMDMKKTWADAMVDCVNREEIAQVTKLRLASSFRSKWFDSIRNLAIVDTEPKDLSKVIACKRPSIVKNLKTLHLFALEQQWLVIPLMANRKLKVRLLKEPIGITCDQHRHIMFQEPNTERRLYYQMLWAVGASQSDGANLKAEDFNPDEKSLFYKRMKTAGQCYQKFVSEVYSLLTQLPQSGQLFPNIAKETATKRAYHFKKTCRKCGFEGLTLHSYRKSYAQRLLEGGATIPEAMAALGHKSVSVFLSYAKGAKLACRPIDKELPEPLSKLIQVDFASHEKRQIA